MTEGPGLEVVSPAPARRTEGELGKRASRVLEATGAHPSMGSMPPALRSFIHSFHSKNPCLTQNGSRFGQHHVP